MTQQSRRRFLKATAAVGAAAGLNAAVLAQDEGDGQAEEPEEYILLGGNTQGWEPYLLPGDASAEEADQNPTLNLQAGTTYALLWRNVDGQPHNFAIQDQDGENLEVLQPLEVDSDQFDQLNESDGGDDAEVTLETSQPGDGNETDGGDGNESDGDETTAEGEGQLLGATETVTEEGAVQGLQFTASDDMNQYICPVHPNTMVGDVELTEGGDDGGEGNETNGEENESA